MNILRERKQRAYNLKDLRLNSGLTQIKLSELSGLSQCAISKLERGNVSWSIDTELIYTQTIYKFLQHETSHA